MEGGTVHARRRHLRAFASILAAVSVGLVTFVAASSSAAATNGGALRGTFTVQFPKGHSASNAPCPAEVFCGVGSLTGYGQATISILEETFSEIEGSGCLEITREEQINLLSGAGSLVIDGVGTFCRPGGSGESHASPKSYGAPGRFDLVFSVNGAASSGIFVGATGTGTEVMNVNGGIGVWHLSGVVG
jgi:hypothetical protein